MKPMALNLRDAKKVATDGKTSTFELGSGHQVRILHSAVPALQRKQMERMPLCKGSEINKIADGGDVLPKYMKPPKNPKMEAVGTGGVAYAEGGKIKEDESYMDTAKRYGGYIKDGVQDMIDNPPSPMEAIKGIADNNHSPKMPKDQEYAKGGSVKMYAEGTADQPVSDQDMAPQEPVQDVQPPEVVPPSPQEAQVPIAQPQMPNPVNQMTNNQINPQVAPTTADRPLYNQNGTANVPAAVALQIEAEKQKRDAAVAEGAQAANIQHGMNAATIVQAQNDQNRYNELKGHADDLSRDMQFINPNHYMESKSTLGRVATAMGLFLGGLGGGIAHTGGNAALDYLSRQIDRDIDSQKANNEKRKTIYGAYKELYGEGNTASNMTKVSMNNLYDGQMKELAAKMATPRAMANYNAFHADILLKNHELLRTSTADAALPRAGGTNLNIQLTPLDRGPVRQQPGQAMPAKRSQPGSVKSDTNSDHILAPGVEQHFQNAAVGKDPRFEKDYDEVRHQLEGASLTDKAIDAINEHFPAMYQSIINGEPELERNSPVDATAAAVKNTMYQLPGYLRRKAETLEDVPYIGKGIAGTAKAITDTGDNRRYDQDKDSALTSMSAALVHAGLTPTEAHATALDFAPIEGDSRADVQRKMEKAKQKLRMVTKTNALERHQLIRSEKKR